MGMVANIDNYSKKEVVGKRVDGSGQHLVAWGNKITVTLNLLLKIFHRLPT